MHKCKRDKKKAWKIRFPFAYAVYCAGLAFHPESCPTSHPLLPIFQALDPVQPWPGWAFIANEWMSEWVSRLLEKTKRHYCKISLYKITAFKFFFFLQCCKTLNKKSIAAALHCTLSGTSVIIEAGLNIPLS